MGEKHARAEYIRSPSWLALARMKAKMHEPCLRKLFGARSADESGLDYVADRDRRRDIE